MPPRSFQSIVEAYPRIENLRKSLPESFLLPGVACLGVLLLVYVVVTQDGVAGASTPSLSPASSPFLEGIAGAGVVEPSSQNIAIGTSVPGIVRKVHVKVGDMVAANDPLFLIDDRAAKAEVAVRRSIVNVATAQLENARTQFESARVLREQKAVSREEFNSRKAAYDSGVAKLGEAQAQLEVAEVNLEQLTVRAPGAGQILQLNIRPGEFARTGAVDPPLLVLGDISQLHVRIDIDEHDATRMHAGVPAVASLKGNPGQKFALKFVRMEPLVVPKRSLTGANSERVDTRVLQVIYAFQDPAPGAYVGQQVDVYLSGTLTDGGSEGL